MPAAIKKMFDTADTHPDGKRKRETDIINSVFAKKGKGWVIDPTKPIFQEAAKQTSGNYSDDGQIAKPFEVWACEFHGGQKCA